MRNYLALGLTIAALAGPVIAGPPPLAGAWKLVETRQRMSDGSIRPDPDLGAHPTGYMIYDPSGRMCTVFNDSDRPRWAGAHPTDAEVRSAYDHMLAYCARYEVDAARGVIVFHIDVAQSANGVGMTRERRFDLKGDALTLYPTPLPAGVTEWSIHLRRVRP
ncbi:MAG TPA: lipocalin-like domain-containing protein [Caulobacteraceae bacterium]|jgi:hypothetical protein|nr:lipocalin-like domain-containing protein [Caulobacteraceae bacterium]